MQELLIGGDRRTSRFRLRGRVPASKSTDPWSFLLGMLVIARSGLRHPRGIDDVSTAAKPKEYIMKSDSRSADAVGQVDFVVSKAGIPNVAALTPWRERTAVSRAAAMMAFAAGLLVGALGAGADEPARAQPTAERTVTDSVRGQPAAKQFASPNQPGVSASDGRAVDALYRLLIGPQPATSSDSRSSSRLRTAPNDNAAAGSVRRWASPR